MVTHAQTLQPPVSPLQTTSHTWNQKLDAHIHLHAVVPGGGPSLETPGQWTSATPPPGREHHDHWLVDAGVLRAEFRKRFLRGLKQLHRRKALNLNAEWSHLRNGETFAAWLQPLESIDWVTYIQPPPAASSQPRDIVKYLARYLTGGPISDFRLTHYDGHRVTFTARTGTVHGGSDEVEPVTLSAVEFVRRWSLHILPSSYTKSRRFGGLSNHHAKRYLAQCRELLARHAVTDATGENTDALNLAAAKTDDVSHRCDHCNGHLELLVSSKRTSWRDLFAGTLRPPWYDPPLRSAG